MMKLPWLLHIFLLCSVHRVACGSDTETGVKSSCEVTTSGNSGNITCHFEEDISKTKRDFSILRYDLKDDQIHDSALKCAWINVSSVSRLKCIANKGYTFSNVSTTLVLGIPTVTEEFSGKYTCQAVRTSAQDISPCFLKPPPYTVTLSQTEKLEPPFDVRAISATYESITVVWSDSVDGSAERSYRLHYRPQASSQDSHLMVIHSATNVTLTGLEPGTNYTLSMVALNALGESSPESNVMLASTKSLPLGSPCMQKPDNTCRCDVLISAMVIFAVYGCASCVFCILVRRYTEKRVRFPRGRKLRNGSWSFRILLKIVASSVDRRWKPDVAERRGQELYGFRVDNGVHRVGEMPEESL